MDGFASFFRQPVENFSGLGLILAQNLSVMENGLLDDQMSEFDEVKVSISISYASFARFS